MSSSPRPVARRRARPIIEGPTYMSPRYHSRWGRVIFLVIILAVIAIVGGSGGLYWALHRAQGGSSRHVLFHVGAGDSVTGVADRLSSEGLLSNTLLFRLDARIQGLGGKLKVGDYTLRHNMSIDQMVAALSRYKAPTVRVTIPEGKRIEEIAAILRSRGIRAKSFLQEARHPDPKYLQSPILQDKPKGASLEGYLFPDTYYVSPHSSGKEFARLMVQQMGKEVSPGMLATLHSRHRTVFQMLTLASIVEREARLASERPTIAGVYWNRLTKTSSKIMDADPTVQYAIGKPGDWWPVLRNYAVDIAPNSPYNSYTHGGLPPGPIANPGLGSIAAAVRPSKTPYFYFVAVKGGHGKHVFARTLAEQNANIQKYG